MKKLIFTMAFAACFAAAQAQTNEKRGSMNLWGYVVDSFLQTGLEGAKLTLMTADSTVVDSIRTYPYDGIHRFTITDIQLIASPIYYETNAITVKTTEAKLIKNRNKTFGNRLYLKNPTYYVGDLSNADVTHDTEGMIVNNVM